jgi:hypothetical protein
MRHWFCALRARLTSRNERVLPESIIHECVHEHAVQVARLGGKQFGQASQLRVVFDRLQHGSPFRVG